MEVLLLEDLPGVGKKNDLLVVGDGFALNNLLPNRIALVATPTVRRRYAEQIRRRAEEKAKELASQQAGASQLKGKIVKLSRKATGAGKLYAAITEKLIAEELKKQHELEIAASAIKIAEPIKSLGLHAVEVELAGSTHSVEVEVAQEK